MQCFIVKSFKFNSMNLIDEFKSLRIITWLDINIGNLSNYFTQPIVQKGLWTTKTVDRNPIARVSVSGCSCLDKGFFGTFAGLRHKNSKKYLNIT